MNISGNYNTDAKEIDIVKYFLNQNNIKYKSVEKYENMDEADVIVTLQDNKTFTVEVKEENYIRISKYNDLGIDLVSNCIFKEKSRELIWKGSPKKPELFNSFIADLDEQNAYFKWGKVVYSKADLWLFFSINDKKIEFCDIYDGKMITDKSFFDYLKSNCLFVVNNKPIGQLSHFDLHQSAVFFINRNNPKLNKFKIDIKSFVEKL